MSFSEKSSWEAREEVVFSFLFQMVHLAIMSNKTSQPRRSVKGWAANLKVTTLKNNYTIGKITFGLPKRVSQHSKTRTEANRFCTFLQIPSELASITRRVSCVHQGTEFRTTRDSKRWTRSYGHHIFTRSSLCPMPLEHGITSDLADNCSDVSDKTATLSLEQFLSLRRQRLLASPITSTFRARLSRHCKAISERIPWLLRSGILCWVAQE